MRGILVEVCQAFTESISGKARHCLHVQLVHNVLAMGFNGLYAKVEKKSNFLGIVSFCDKLEYLALAR